MLLKLADIFKVPTDYLLGMGLLCYGFPDSNDEYCHDPEVARIAQEMHDESGRRVLFDASRGLSKESIEEVRRFMEYQKAKELGDFD